MAATRGCGRDQSRACDAVEHRIFSVDLDEEGGWLWARETAFFAVSHKRMGAWFASMGPPAMRPPALAQATVRSR